MITEAARAAITFGFEQLGLTELVVFTSIRNVKSRTLMERLRMTFAVEFAHPHVSVESGLRQHMLYRLDSPLREGSSSQWTGRL